MDKCCFWWIGGKDKSFATQHFNLFSWSSRKAYLLTKTLAILSPFLLPPKKRGKKKKENESENCDQKSCLSARSIHIQ